jgi:hypothetical protein
MDQGFRRGFTAAEKTELWDRWQRGESLKAIGRTFGKPSSSIYFQLSPYGGIRPAPRSRSRLALTLSGTRGDIERHCGPSIGALDGRVAGPLALDGEPGNQPERRLDGYRAALADEKAWARTRRPKRCKLATNAWLRQAVASKLRLNWAPERIAGWLKRAHPETSVITCHTRRSIAVYFVKPEGCLRKSCFAIFGRTHDPSIETSNRR